tara:strand:- start:130 stop:411 length:282 start_codon:yes stop_codon:yes gene_type:complete
MQRKTLMNMDTEKFNQNIDWVIAGEVYGSGTITEDVTTHADYDSKKTEITNEYNTYQANLPTAEEVEALKASAKAKLIAGEALTEDEANTIVL